MKKAIALALSLLLAVFAAGCGKETTNTSSVSSSTMLIPEDNWNEIPSEEVVSELTSSEDASSELVSTAVSSNNQVTSSKNATLSSDKSVASSSKPAEQPAPEPGTLREIYQPTFAKGFKIEYYYGGAKIISTSFTSATEENQNFVRSQRILLLPDGAVKPKDTLWDAEVTGTVERVVTLASSHAGHFANLDAVDVVKGTSIKSAAECEVTALKAALENGKTVSVTNQSSGKGWDYELIVSLKPQIVFVGGMQTDIDAAKKLEESGLVCLYVGDFAEADYMGRAQWIELFGAFIGKEAQGQTFLKKGVERANAVIARAAKIKEKPNVIWFSKVGMPVTSWYLKTDNDYSASLVRALGGKMIYPEGATGTSQKIDHENFLQYMPKADKFIYGVSLRNVTWNDKSDITIFNVDDKIDFTTTKAYQNDDCYAVGYDWSQDTANIGDIMEGLAKALYPEEFKDITNPTKIIKFKKNA